MLFRIFLFLFLATALGELEQQRYVFIPIVNFFFLPLEMCTSLFYLVRGKKNVLRFTDQI